MNEGKDFLQDYNREKYQLSKAKHILDTGEDEVLRINICDYFPQHIFNKQRELEKLPIQDIIDMFEWKDGKCKFFACASKDFFHSNTLFGVVQSRRDEIEALGHKVKEVEGGAWGTLTRTWIVYDLERSKRNKQGLVFNVVVCFTCLALWLWFGFSK